MKTYLIYIIICFNGFIYSQDLTTQFNQVSNNHDMMGGSLVVFCENGIIENITIGKADLARDINLSANTKYRIASISKTITAIAIMQLVDQNLINLNDDISSILGYTVQNPNFPNTAITIKMLLSHTSSIIDGSTYSNFLSNTVNQNPIPDLQEILTTEGSYYTSAQFNNTVPGTYFNYSNINYVILGTILEKVTNQRFDIYCKENISDPLGIDASFNVNHLTNIDELAVIYRKISGNWVAQTDNYQGFQPTFSNLENYIPGKNGGRFGPQGGFRCSANDLAKIMLTLMNNGSYEGTTLLSEASTNLMMANEWTYNGYNGNNLYGLFLSWGLGIHRITSTSNNDIALPQSNAMLGHAGEAYGLVSSAYFDTNRKAGFVFLTNGVGNGFQTNSNSEFYTVEQDVFNAIENYGNIETCTEALSTKTFRNSKPIFYPNPTTDSINITELNINTSSKIKIYSTTGILVKTIEINENTSKISIKELNAGIYFLSIKNVKYPIIKL